MAISADHLSADQSRTQLDLGQGDRLVIEKIELSELTFEDFILADEIL